MNGCIREEKRNKEFKRDYVGFRGVLLVNGMNDWKKVKITALVGLCGLQIICPHTADGYGFLLRTICLRLMFPW